MRFYQIAQRFSSDREAYTEGKTEHIALVMQRARRWLGGKRLDNALLPSDLCA